MRQIVFILLGFTAMAGLRAQGTFQAEYFFDNDPGVGNATPIAITGTEVLSGTESIDISNLSPGFHDWYVRVRQNGVWGHYGLRRTFYIGSIDFGAASGPIEAAEYFFNTDPGVGNGTAMSITPGVDVTANAAIDISDLSPGFHSWYVRTRQNGVWGHYGLRRAFYIKVVDTSVQAPIDRVEAFFNEDPGVGNGMLVQVGPGLSINTNATFPVGNLTQGTHSLYIRVLDENDAVSHYVTHEIVLCDFAQDVPEFEVSLPTSCSENTFNVQISIPADWDGPAYEVSNNINEQVLTVAAGTSQSFGPFTSGTEVEFLADDDFTDEICPVQLSATFTCYDCQELEVNNGDDCNLEGLDGTYEDCLCETFELDCLNVPEGTAEIDECGVCYENGEGNPLWNTTCLDCEGVLDGTSETDLCGECLEGGAGNPLWNACTDCNGVPYGEAMLDNCGECVGGNTGEEACVEDCNGDFGGTAFLDNCNECVGGNTGDEACENIDIEPPVAVCQDIILYLDASGMAVINSPEELDGGSTDNDSIASFAVDISNFDCSHLGPNNVTLTVTDVNGNSDTCIAVVTVQDAINPTIVCAAGGSRIIDQPNTTYAVSGTEFDPIAVDDNCSFTVTHSASGIAGAVAGPTAGSLAGWQLPEGVHSITFTVEDVAGNTDTCTVTIAVVPIVLNGNMVINLNCVPADVRVRVYEEGTTVMVASYVTSVGVNGDFTLPLSGVGTGNHDIFVKVDGYLQKGVYNENIFGYGIAVSISNLAPGDIAGGLDNFNDNVVNSLDLSLLLNHYYTESGDPNFNERCDFNCNGQVDGLDMSILSFFYNAQGDNPAP